MIRKCTDEDISDEELEKVNNLKNKLFFLFFLINH